MFITKDCFFRISLFFKFNNKKLKIYSFTSDRTFGYTTSLRGTALLARIFYQLDITLTLCARARKGHALLNVNHTTASIPDLSLPVLSIIRYFCSMYIQKEEEDGEEEEEQEEEEEEEEEEDEEEEGKCSAPTVVVIERRAEKRGDDRRGEIVQYTHAFSAKHV